MANVISLLKEMVRALLPIQIDPVRWLKKRMIGIIGGMLILAAMTTSTLFSLKMKEAAMAMIN